MVEETLEKTAVGAFVRDRQGRYLLLQRSSDSTCWPGAWEVPGGKVEPGESPEEALLREVKEETGLCVFLDAEVGRAEFELGGRRGCMRFWTARVSEGSVRLSEEDQDYAWLVLPEFLGRELSPPVRVFLEKMTIERGRDMGGLL